MSSPDTTIRVKLASSWEDSLDSRSRPCQIFKQLLLFTFVDPTWQSRLTAGSQTSSSTFKWSCQQLPFVVDLTDCGDTHCTLQLEVSTGRASKQLVFAHELQEVVAEFGLMLEAMSGRTWHFVPDDEITIHGGVTMGDNSAWRVKWLDEASIAQDRKHQSTRIMVAELGLRPEVTLAQRVHAKIGMQINFSIRGHELSETDQAEIMEIVRRNRALVPA